MNSSNSLSQYKVSEASFLLMKTLFRKSLFELPFFASIKFAPILVADRINCSVIGRTSASLGNSLKKSNNPTGEFKCSIA